MGVDLGGIVPVHETSLAQLRGRVVAIDGYNMVYQFLASIRGSDGQPLKDRQGRTTSHLSGILYRLANLVEAGVLPVIVWDGEPPEEKADTIQDRRERREAAREAMEEALKRGDLETARTKAAQAARIEPHTVPSSNALLDALGVPHVQAPAEGEAQAAALVVNGHAHAVASQDYDALLFGAPRLVRNLAVGNRRKLPGRDRWVDVVPERIDLDETLDALELTREQLVLAGVLVGTDYWPGVKGVGPKTALQTVREHPTAEEAAKALDADAAVIDATCRLFLEARTDGSIEPTWPTPRPDDAVEFLVREHAFSEGRVRSAVERYAKLKDPTRQAGLFDF